MNPEDQPQDNLKGYTRVTTILAPFSGLDKVDPLIIQRAADRGSKVHTICEGIMKGLGAMDVTPDVLGFIRSFEKWWSPDFGIKAIEQRFYCDVLEITGQVDLIMQDDEDPNGCIILDLKTSYKESLTWPLQGAAYAYMARKSGYPVTKIQFLHLSRNGIMPIVREYPYKQHFDTFMHCYHVHRYFNPKPKKKNA